MPIRTTEMTKDQKIDYVASGLLPVIQNDLRLVVESGCPEHGCGTGPNFAVALLCMVACETVGALSALERMPGRVATRLFISRLGGGRDRGRYDNYAGLMFHLFRNGIGHSFRPKQAKGLSGWALWMTPCVDKLRTTAEGRLQVDNLRLSRHLTIDEHPEGRRFNIVTKILYLDVSQAISEFQAALEQRAPVINRFEAAFDRWQSANEQIQHKKGELSAFELAAIGDGAEA
jgi:hypothetical protein